jgi:hypothetical protein
MKMTQYGIEDKRIPQGVFEQGIPLAVILYIRMGKRFLNSAV